jgi:hypothetical protein
MFSNKQWVDPPFCQSELDGLPGTVITDEPAPAGGVGSTTATKRRKCRHKKHRARSSRRHRCHKKKRR